MSRFVYLFSVITIIWGMAVDVATVIYVSQIPSSYCFRPILVAARPKAWVCGRSLARIVGSEPAGGVDVRLLWSLCVVR